MNDESMPEGWKLLKKQADGIDTVLWPSKNLQIAADLMKEMYDAYKHSMKTGESTPLQLAFQKFEEWKL